MIFDKTLDLHNINPQQIEFELESFLKHSYLEGDHLLLVITGKGKGIMHREVIRILKGSKLVKKIETPIWGYGDEGAIAVWLLGC